MKHKSLVRRSVKVSKGRCVCGNKAVAKIYRRDGINELACRYCKDFFKKFPWYE